MNEQLQQHKLYLQDCKDQIEQSKKIMKDMVSNGLVNNNTTNNTANVNYIFVENGKGLDVDLMTLPIYGVDFGNATLAMLLHRRVDNVLKSVPKPISTWNNWSYW